MKTKTTRAVVLFLIAALGCVVSSAQHQPTATTTPTMDGAVRYDKDGLAFDYPAGWTLTDRSDAGAQHLQLSRQGISAAIVVLVPRELISKFEQLLPARSGVTKPYADSFAQHLGLAAPGWDEAQCQPVGGQTGFGFRLSGRHKGEPHTGEVYAALLSRRYVNVAYVRADKDEALAGAAWKSVLDSLKVAEPANAPPLDEELKDVVMAGILNGRAVKKPAPEYPPIALSSRVQGTVTVQITVDENGDVVWTKAVNGPRQLYDAAERAARKAKFTPTRLCAKAVRVTGVITYNFVLLP